MRKGGWNIKKAPRLAALQNLDESVINGKSFLRAARDRNMPLLLRPEQLPGGREKACARRTALL